MENWQILWGVNTFFLAVMGALYGVIRADLKELREDIKSRTLTENCDKIHRDVKEQLHRHGSLGNAGEVIK